MSKKALWWVVAIIVIVVAVAAYFQYGRPAEQAAAPLDLDGSSFALASYDGAAIPEGATYPLSFSDGSIHAKFCNSMNGPYELADGTLTSTLASTQMFCTSPANLMEIENAFGQLLTAGASVSVADDTLTLSGGDTTLVFTRTAE